MAGAPSYFARWRIFLRRLRSLCFFIFFRLRLRRLGMRVLGPRGFIYG